jgi:uncharacterized protein (DUF427 family)
MSLSPAYEKYPDHSLEFDKVRVVVRISVGGDVIAQTTQGLNLREGRYPKIVYVPRQDVQMDRLTRSDHSTHCPFKGDATYFDFVGGPERVEQVAWSYDDPFDQMAEIRGHLAFYSDRAQIEILGD